MSGSVTCRSIQLNLTKSWDPNCLFFPPNWSLTWAWIMWNSQSGFCITGCISLDKICSDPHQFAAVRPDELHLATNVTFLELTLVMSLELGGAQLRIGSDHGGPPFFVHQALGAEDGASRPSIPCLKFIQCLSPQRQAMSWYILLGFKASPVRSGHV